MHQKKPQNLSASLLRNWKKSANAGIVPGLQAATPKMTPSRILGRCRVQGSCVIAGGTIKDDARISGCAFVDTKSVVKDNARLSGCASLVESLLDRNAVVYGNEEIVAEAIGDASKVTNCPDKARGGNSDCCQQHQGIMFDAVLVDLDGLAVTVMFTTTGTEIRHFTINGGDGTPASPVTPPAAHTSSVPGTYVATRNYGSAGTRVVTVFASEDTTNRMQIEITVGNGESWRKLE